MFRIFRILSCLPLLTILLFLIMDHKFKQNFSWVKCLHVLSNYAISILFPVLGTITGYHYSVYHWHQCQLLSIKNILYHFQSLSAVIKVAWGMECSHKKASPFNLNFTLTSNITLKKCLPNAFDDRYLFPY